MDNDKLLVKEILNGNNSAFSTLIKNYQKKMFNFFYRLTYSNEDAEEMVQDVFVNVFKYLYKYNPKYSFNSWIYAIASNIFKNHHTKKKRQVKSFAIDDKTNKVPSTFNVEELYKEKESLFQILKLFECLVHEQKIALTLRHLNNFSYEEIGKILNISTNAAKMKVYRAKQILADRYFEIMKRGD